jgi:hypothetical protein
MDFCEKGDLAILIRDIVSGNDITQDMIECAIKTAREKRDSAVLPFQEII